MACATTGAYQEDIGDFQRYQVMPTMDMQRYIDTPEVISALLKTPRPLRPTDRDFLTINTDLNGDGRPDIVGTVDNFKFKENGTYPLYILIGNQYDYDIMDSTPRIRSFKVKVLDTSTNGFKDISADGKIYKFDGKKYE